MWVNLNIGLLLGVTLPPLIYAFIIYLTSPHGAINLKKSLFYVLGGIFSVTFVYLMSAFIEMESYNHFMKHFFIVGPREELCKFLAFFIMTASMKNTKLHPVAIMFYMGMVGLGFALYENLLYTFRYGDMVLLTRSFSSTLGHMIFCMFFGYWLGLSQINKGKYGARSIFGSYMQKYKKLKTIVYGLIGLICAASFHGLWNYNLSQYTSSTMPLMVLMVIMGLITCKFAAADLNNHYRLSLKKPNSKPTNDLKLQWLKGEGPQTD
jgi:RsiW-degrading membrane proteinase PrsW (M82 family)